MTEPPAATAQDPEDRSHHDEEMPRVVITRERALIFGLFVASAVAFLYFVLPKLAGLGDTWHRLGQGDSTWLLVAFAFECLSFAGYVLVFRTVFVRAGSRIDFRASYQITMAGLAATRLFAAAGAGGIALTAWALRRSGMGPRDVAGRMLAFLVLLYTVYAGALVLVGLGLYLGVLSGAAPFAITVVPAVFGALAFLGAAGMACLPGDAERWIAVRGQGEGRGHRLLARAASVPASVATGIRTAIGLVREGRWGVLGAFAWWAFDIAVLWACFHAYGVDPPPVGVIVMAYFVGMLANTLPLPGGIGGVDGGMIGAFAAFDVPFGYATVAVLTYRAFAFWLPTLPGAIAYFQLRRTVAGWREERGAVGEAQASTGGLLYKVK
ncbi:MAG: flippase-like domain-containing protein [Actinomycetota bacterium]|nr:flippase-like domain-containing protein [Actinomycetota bacterium]